MFLVESIGKTAEKLVKSMLAVSVSIVMFCIFSVTVLAAGTIQDGMDIQLTTDKENYSDGEKIKAELLVKNTGETDVTDIVLQIISEEYQPDSQNDSSKIIEKLSPGETVAFYTVYTAVSSDQTIVSGTDSQISSDNQVSLLDNRESSENPFVIIIVGTVVVFGGIILIVWLFKRKKLSKIMSAVIGVSLLGTALNFSDNANAAGKYLNTILVVQDFKVGGTESTIQGKVRYASSEKNDEEISVLDADNYYNENAEVISVTDVVDAKNIYTEKEVIDLCEERGLNDYPITSEFLMNGNAYDEEEIGDIANEKHPLYQLFYISPKEMLWTIYITNGTVSAYPVSYNLVSDKDVPLLITETDTVIGYDNETNRYYETIPKRKSVIVMKVEKIDRETLDLLTMEVLADYEG